MKSSEITDFIHSADRQLRELDASVKTYRSNLLTIVLNTVDKTISTVPIIQEEYYDYTEIESILESLNLYREIVLSLIESSVRW